MYFLATVNVRFKKSVLEPQGAAVLLSVKDGKKENYKKAFQKIRIGKLIELNLEADSKEKALELVDKLTEDLLYNPVMEVKEVSIIEIEK